ncbi:MAG: hypothetical protein ABW321_30685 [Polyangiales bacterium]
MRALIVLRPWARGLSSLCLAVLAHACSLETAQRGQRCYRSSQCAPGLACVADRCSADLREIAATSQVPDLGAAAGEDAGAQ